MIGSCAGELHVGRHSDSRPEHHSSDDEDYEMGGAAGAAHIFVSPKLTGYIDVQVSKIANCDPARHRVFTQA
jgi:hypothetical protein